MNYPKHIIVVIFLISISSLTFGQRILSTQITPHNPTDADIIEFSAELRFGNSITELLSEAIVIDDFDIYIYSLYRNYGGEMESTWTYSTELNPLPAGDYRLIYNSNGSLISVQLDTLFFSVESSNSFALVKDNNEHFVYPNPAKDFIYVEINGHQECEFIISDLNGRLVKSEIIRSEKFMISLDGIASGLYFYTIFKNGIPHLNGKLIVE
jgi:hypothetical protein